MSKSMSRRSFVLASGALASMMLFGCGTEEKSADKSTSEKPVKKAEEEKAPVSVTVDGAQLGTDYDGQQCVVVNYTFSNDSGDKSVSFGESTLVYVYQNGVQCDTTICDSADDNSAWKKVQIGSSLPVQEAYAIQDTSEIDVQVFALGDIASTKLAEQKIALA